MRVSGMATARLVDGMANGLGEAASLLQGMVKSPVSFSDPALHIGNAVVEGELPTCRTELAGVPNCAMELAFVGRSAGELLEALRDLDGPDDVHLAREIMEEIGQLVVQRCGDSIGASLPSLLMAGGKVDASEVLVLESLMHIPERRVSGMVSLTVRPH